MDKLDNMQKKPLFYLTVDMRLQHFYGFYQLLPLYKRYILGNKKPVTLMNTGLQV